MLPSAPRYSKARRPTFGDCWSCKAFRPILGERMRGFACAWPLTSSPVTAATDRLPGRGDPISEGARDPPTSEETLDDPASDGPCGDSRLCL